MNPESQDERPSGMPEAVHALFALQRAEIEAWAERIGGQATPPLCLDTTTGTWVRTILCRLAGRRFHFRVVTNDNLADFGLLAVGLYVHRQELYGPQSGDGYLPTGHARQVNAGKCLPNSVLGPDWVARLSAALEQLERSAEEYARNLPASPRPPASA